MTILWSAVLRAFAFLRGWHTLQFDPPAKSSTQFANGENVKISKILFWCLLIGFVGQSDAFAEVGPVLNGAPPTPVWTPPVIPPVVKPTGSPWPSLPPGGGTTIPIPEWNGPVPPGSTPVAPPTTSPAGVSCQVMRFQDGLLRCVRLGMLCVSVAGTIDALAGNASAGEIPSTDLCMQAIMAQTELQACQLTQQDPGDEVYEQLAEIQKILKDCYKFYPTMYIPPAVPTAGDGTPY